jgi:hypothetical protein
MAEILSIYPETQKKCPTNSDQESKGLVLGLPYPSTVTELYCCEGVFTKRLPSNGHSANRIENQLLLGRLLPSNKP